MRSDIVPGSKPPGYELPDHTGAVRRPSELQGEDPLILTLACGHYCPKEDQQHLELTAFYRKIAVAYTQIAAIGTDDHHTIQEFRASVGAQWPFPSDPERRVQKDLDVAEYADPEHNPMIPHTFVLRPGLVIHSIYKGYWLWAAPRSQTSGTTCAPCRARFVPIGSWPRRGCARRGTLAPNRPSTGGTSATATRQNEKGDRQRIS
jgi:peroxiredoxin